MIQRPTTIAEQVPTSFKHELVLHAPLSGELVDFKTVPDPRIQSLVWGRGVAIRTRATSLCSPVDGVIEKLDIANQQWIIRSKNGLRLTIQLGPITTQSVMGERLKLVKKQADKVTKGETITFFDPLFLQQKLGHCYGVMTILNRKGINAIVTEKDNTKVTPENPVIRIYL